MGSLAINVMKNMLEGLKNIEFTQNNVSIMSSLSEENLSQIDALAEELCKKNNKNVRRRFYGPESIIQYFLRRIYACN